jgi:hypothetical protein
VALGGLAGYAAVYATALLARIALAFLPVRFVTGGQERLWSWEFFAVFTLCFVSGILLARRAGLPPPDRIPPDGASAWVPISIGCIVAVMTITLDMIEPAAAARGVPSMHVRGAAAIPFYLYGAVVLTVVFHFLPVAAGAWVARRSHNPARSVILALTLLAVALSEDLMFFVRSASPGVLETIRHVLSVAANGSEAVLTYRFGLLWALLQRVSTYLVWHIAWPTIGEMWRGVLAG